ncbi:unnamed protein product [Hermetia illucens]|uniref:Uncharacterized protein n=1 Tax=Hermetia illucens TaxID=343691 RepID=A0A7R8UKB6_HERIL|nr:pupal cuticle protein Edg-78E-like [Hermetia illucens]CAD7082436.1 unnamed protein product [Hermetia illucens]
MFKAFVIAVILGLAAADHINKDAQTKSFVNDVAPDGQFRYGFDTTNGINVQESGNADAVQGNFKWVSPEGEAVETAYVADVNGYQPTGSHIPVAPPVPEYIVRALEWIRAHPQKEELIKSRY